MFLSLGKKTNFQINDFYVKITFQVSSVIQLANLHTRENHNHFIEQINLKSAKSANVGLGRASVSAGKR